MTRRPRQDAAMSVVHQYAYGLSVFSWHWPPIDKGHSANQLASILDPDPRVQRRVLRYLQEHRRPEMHALGDEVAARLSAQAARRAMEAVRAAR